jgi:hypothetical protein
VILRVIFRDTADPPQARAHQRGEADVFNSYPRPPLNRIHMFVSPFSKGRQARLAGMAVALDQTPVATAIPRSRAAGAAPAAAYLRHGGTCPITSGDRT